MRDNKAMFDKSVGILVRAYLDETLEHGSCAACAVGNLIAGYIDAKVSVNSVYWTRGVNSITPLWTEVFICDHPNPSEIQSVYPGNYKGWVKKQIDASGYTWQELAEIERAFEMQAPYDPDQENQVAESMFNGLMAVVDVLATIHNIDLTAKEEAKKLFVKAV